ncbi:MAG: hypothetical protein ACI4KD_01425 [Oscillospiraceae bacterium]
MSKKENKAIDYEIERFSNVGCVEGNGFEFAKRNKGINKFKLICDTFARSRDISTITFQKGINGEGLTFDENSIESLLLQDDTLSLICDHSSVDRAYFLFRQMTGISYLLIVEKTRCDSVIYYDKRELFEKDAGRLFSQLEDEYYSQQRKGFRLIKKTLKND